MTQIMTASVKPVTEGQIENLVSKFRDAARKLMTGLDGDAFQKALNSKNIGTELFAPFRLRVEATSGVIRSVFVNRDQAPREALLALGRNEQYLDDSVVNAMPKGEGAETEVVFFKIGHSLRSVVLQTLFEWDTTNASEEAAREILTRNVEEFGGDETDRPFMEQLLTGVLAKRPDLDLVIEKAAPDWPLDKIAPVDRNILRIGLYELLFSDRSQVPAKVAINEAIELAKVFGGDSSVVS
jgi:N utilization substance protein B